MEKTELKRGLPPSHPGELLSEILVGLKTEKGMGKGAVAEALGVSRKMLDNVETLKAKITPAMALRLEKLTGGSAEMWMTLQARYDLAEAAAELAPELAKIQPLKAA